MEDCFKYQIETNVPEKQRDDFLRYFLELYFQAGLVKKGRAVYFTIKNKIISWYMNDNNMLRTKENLTLFLDDLLRYSIIWKNFKLVPSGWNNSQENRYFFFKKMIAIGSDQLFPMYAQMFWEYIIKNNSIENWDLKKEFGIVKFISPYKILGML